MSVACTDYYSRVACIDYYSRLFKIITYIISWILTSETCPKIKCFAWKIKSKFANIQWNQALIKKNAWYFKSKEACHLVIIYSIHGEKYTVKYIIYGVFFLFICPQMLAWKTPLLEFPRFYPLFPADENKDKNGVQLYIGTTISLNSFLLLFVSSIE